MKGHARVVFVIDWRRMSCSSKGDCCVVRLRFSLEGCQLHKVGTFFFGFKHAVFPLDQEQGKHEMFRPQLLNALHASSDEQRRGFHGST